MTLDDMLVWARLKLSLKAKRRVAARRKFNVGRLKIQQVVEQFKVNLRNKYSELANRQADDVDEC